MQDGAGGGLLLLDKCGAFRAAAVGVGAVVLAYGYHVLIGIGLEQAVQPFAHNIKYFRVGEAPLAGASGVPFAAEEGVIFGMGRTVTGGGEEFVAGMHPEVVHKEVVGLFQAVPETVEGIGLTYFVYPVVGGCNLSVTQAPVGSLPIAETGDFRALTQLYGRF